MFVSRGAIYLLLVSIAICGCNTASSNVDVRATKAGRVKENKADDAKKRTKEENEENKENNESSSSIDEPESYGEMKEDTAAQRKFRFHYGGAVNELPADAQVRVWLPVPQTDEQQVITEASRQMPAKAGFTADPKYENKILYFETKAPESGTIEFDVAYDVERREVMGLQRSTQSELHDLRRQLFLAANAMVPVDGKPLDLIKDLKLPNDPLKLGQALYDRVDDHMKYDKSKPGYGNGDAVWACDSKFGNCTDFHSLFISMARSQGLPARFEIGFPLPTDKKEGEIGGYHCWAYFYVTGHGWVPVDISEADKHPEMKNYYFGNLTADRVTFTMGRDITLAPKQAGEPLNYFVYPYVEVNGEPWPQEKVEKRFKFKDA